MIAGIHDAYASAVRPGDIGKVSCGATSGVTPSPIDSCIADRPELPHGAAAMSQLIRQSAHWGNGAIAAKTSRFCSHRVGGTPV